VSIYYLDSGQLSVIQRVMKRLYTEQRLTGDQMRDLANTLDAVTHSVLTYGEADAGDPPLTPARADRIVDLVTEVVHGLADQQAMPDEAWKPKLDAIIATVYLKSPAPR